MLNILGIVSFSLLVVLVDLIDALAWIDGSNWLLGSFIGTLAHDKYEWQKEDYNKSSLVRDWVNRPDDLDLHETIRNRIIDTIGSQFIEGDQLIPKLKWFGSTEIPLMESTNGQIVVLTRESLDYIIEESNNDKRALEAIKVAVNHRDSIVFEDAIIESRP